MSNIFNPNGVLDVATDASDLPEQGVDQYTTQSSALTRCKNLRLNQAGKALTRDGSAKVNTTAINTAIWLLKELGGVRYAFAGANIYRNETSIASGLTSAQWSAIDYNSYNDTTQQLFAINGTDRKRIAGSTVSEWGITAPTTAPTVATGSSTGLTGDYNAKYSYARLSGTTVIAESNLSSAGSAAVTLSNESLSITWTASSDSQVTHVGVYRTLTGGSTYFLDQYVAIGTTTLDSDAADASLTTQEATTHNRPPLGSAVYGPSYDGTCFIIKDNLLYYCLPKQPEYWPTAYFIEVTTPAFPGKCGAFYNGQFHFFSKREIVYIQGTGDGLFFPIPLKCRTGAQGPFGALSVEGKGIYHTGPDGLYLYSGTDQKITETRFEPIFRGETVNGIPGCSDNLATAWLHEFKNKLYFGYTSVGKTYPTNVFVINMVTDKVEYYVYNDGSDIEIRCLLNDETNNRLLIGDNTGFVRQIEDRSQTTDSGTAISWETQSKDFTLSTRSGTAISWETQSKDFTLSTRAHFPRWVKYDIDASSAASCTGTVLLDGAVHQTHTITGNRKTKRRLVKTGNGSRLAHKVSGSGPVTLYMVESE
jgi:hypothetical protein